MRLLHVDMGPGAVSKGVQYLPFKLNGFSITDAASLVRVQFGLNTRAWNSKVKRAVVLSPVVDVKNHSLGIFVHISDSFNTLKHTLLCHKVCKIPYQFPDEKFFTEFIKHREVLFNGSHLMQPTDVKHNLWFIVICTRKMFKKTGRQRKSNSFDVDQNCTNLIIFSKHDGRIL